MVPPDVVALQLTRDGHLPHSSMIREKNTATADRQASGALYVQWYAAQHTHTHSHPPKLTRVQYARTPTPLTATLPPPIYTRATDTHARTYTLAHSHTAMIWSLFLFSLSNIEDTLSSSSHHLDAFSSARYHDSCSAFRGHVCSCARASQGACAFVRGCMCMRACIRRAKNVRLRIARACWVGAHVLSAIESRGDTPAGIACVASRVLNRICAHTATRTQAQAHRHTHTIHTSELNGDENLFRCRQARGEKG